MLPMLLCINSGVSILEIIGTPGEERSKTGDRVGLRYFLGRITVGSL